MGKRTRKPPVRPEVTREWLKRYEVDGESPPQIALSDGYDVRTVRKQLDAMRQEREIREAKQVVLRLALERHYADLCAFAEKLRADLSGDLPKSVSAILKEGPMRTALKEHLPRAAMWRGLQRWDDISSDVESSIGALNARTRKEAPVRASLPFTSSAGAFGLWDGITDAIVFHTVNTARGVRGLEGVAYTEGKANQGVRLYLGSYGLALVPKDQVPTIEDACSSILQESSEWEEAGDLSRKIGKFVEIQRGIRDELTRIMLRRVVPGRCSYCPFY